MTDGIHERVMHGMADVIGTHDWPRLADFYHADAILEFPQSREVFRGLDNIRAQFANYPGMGPGTSELQEVIGDPKAYVLAPSYTVIAVDGTGDRGTSVVRVRYPDDSHWYAINLYELRDGRISRVRTYFAPDFDAPDWRAPYREAP